MLLMGQKACKDSQKAQATSVYGRLIVQAQTRASIAKILDAAPLAIIAVLINSQDR